MKQYLITGLCKREYRGKGRDTTLQTTIEANSKKEAGEKFEAINVQYSAASIAELPKAIAKDVRDDKDSVNDDFLSSGGMDVDSDEADSENKE